MKLKKIVLLSIIVFAFFLRVYKLGSYPVGFLWDEASLGYNAYSILETGRDEYGRILPLIFKSFGDYKPGLYVYLTIPFILIFGLGEFAVRLPSALFGAFSVVLMYFLVKEGQKKEVSLVPLISALLLAISPWHLIFSRGAWELNIMLFEFIFGFYFLTKFINTQKDKFLYFCTPAFLLTLLTYQSAKFLLPVLLSVYFFFFRKELFQSKKKSILSFSLTIFSIFIVFNVLTVLGGKGGRIKAMSIFSYPRSGQETQMFLTQDRSSNLLYSFFHGPPVFFVRSVLGRYFNHFSGKFLFITGDWSNQRNGIVYQGVMYYLDVVFLCSGLFYLFAKKRSSFENFMLFWLMIAPFPAALTRDSISSVRSFTMVIPLVFVVATGVDNLRAFLYKKKRVFRCLGYLLFAICYLLLLIRMLDFYFIHDPKTTSENRLYGYRQAVSYIKPLVSQKNKIIFTSKYGQPYIFYLFYSKYDPLKYQKQALLAENPYGDVGQVEKVDKIEFRKIFWPNDRAFNNSLFVGDEFDLPLTDVVGQEKITLREDIKFLNGKTAFRIVETK